MSTFNTTYTRRDVNSIYQYLKEQASLLSNGTWTDFSSGDIGSVLLGLMAYLADQNNFQLDKTACELFLDTALERSSLIALLKLVGYEPRHYESAQTTLTFTSTQVSDASTLIPAYTSFTNTENTVTYTTLENIYLSEGNGSGLAFEGTRVSKTYTYQDITTTGKIYLPDYKIGMNTIQLYIPSVSKDLIPKVENVKFTDGDICFSAHISEDATIYIQLPSFWTDIISESSLIYVSYLLSSGEAGRVGSNIITKCTSMSINQLFNITNTVSIGGYFPETVDEIKNHAPANVRTMDTIVTKSDMKQLVEASIPDVASCLAGDYNDDWTGYTQPDDAYKCKVLIVPANIHELSIFIKDEHGYKQYTNIDETDIYWYDENNNVLYDADYQVSTVPLDELIVSYTSTGKEVTEFIDKRRLSSLMISYLDAKRVTPTITLNIYTDPNDLRTGTIASSVFTYMTQQYDREKLQIGQSLYGSTIGRDLLNAFDEITYVEVVEPDINISCAKDEYIDMYWSTYNIYVNDTLIIDHKTNQE